MDTVNSFDLVKGDFTPEKALEVLSALVNDKIKYHHSEMLSLQERFGADTSHSQRRVAELKVMMNELKDLVEYASSQGKELKIEGKINITMVDAPAMVAV